MPKVTSGDTAIKIKERIKKYDKFIFVASDAAIDSKWCNWELGYGDAITYADKKIALFPITKKNDDWKGNEYMQIYPTVQYFDGTQKYRNGEFIPEGFYYRYKDIDGLFCLIPIMDWLNS